MKPKILLFLILLLTIELEAQNAKYSNEFLAIGVGARALGMSNATVASISDGCAGYWNPSGLVQTRSNMQLSLMHAEYFAGIAKYDFGSLVAKIDNTSSLGFSIIRFGVDDIPDTSELIDANGNINYDKIKSFSAADYAFITSYSRKTNNIPLKFGGSIKIIHRKIGNFAKSWGFGLDFGTQYSLNKWQFGFVARDVTTTFNAWSYTLTDQMKDVFAVTGNDIPTKSLEITKPKIIIGACRKDNISKKLHIMPELDLEITTDGKRNVLIKSKPFSIDPKLGIELDYNDMVFLRAGVGNFQKETISNNKKTTTLQPNIGIGVNIKDVLQIDYALTDVGNKSIAVYSNIFSLRFNINKSTANVPKNLN